MPIYYNPASPTPSSKNTINSVAVTYGIRDFLLNKNLTPSSTLPAGYSTNTAINGSPKVGEPVLDTMVNSGANVIPNYLPLEVEGIVWKDLNILPNTFKNTASDANDLVGIDYVQDIGYASPDGLTSFGPAEWPQGITSYPNGVESYGLLPKTQNAKFKLGNVKKNIYLDESKQFDVADFIVAQPNDITQQIKGYLDEYGGLNFGGGSGVGGTGVQAANVIGSVLNGQGLGLAKGGVVTNFDVRSSLAGRVLGATGFLKDTKLGTIGGQQLALALANNAAFNVQQEILGKLNIKDNVLSLIKGNGLAGFRPSYKITVPESGLGRALDFTGKILGFTLPRSYMTDGGSIFQSESGNVDNITRANELLKTTGKGQLTSLINNIRANQYGSSPTGVDNPDYTDFRTGYAPGYILDNKGDENITDGILYAFGFDGTGLLIDLFCTRDSSGKGTPTIPVLNYEREKLVSQTYPDFIQEGRDSYEQTDGSNVNRERFSWGTNEGGITNSDFYGDYIPFIGEKKNLLTKTQKLFNSNGMKTIVTRDGLIVDGDTTSTQIQTANGGGFSKGSAVLSAIMYGANGRYSPSSGGTPEYVYCRSWTTKERYDYVFRMVRSGTYETNGLYGYDSGRVPFRLNTENTVLEDTGFVKMAPYRDDYNNPDLDDKALRNTKNYMLSIENLAWADRVEQLPKGERGVGDPITGKRGRMMWFPPYDIQISESVSVDWEPHKFIGRGENIYTYNNTERTGQLSFKIIVDHSTYMNTFRGANGPDDNYVASFVAGCIEPDSFWTDKFTVSQNVKLQPDVSKIPQERKAPPTEIEPGDLYVFFPNDQASVPVLYESGISGTTTPTSGVPDYNQPINYDVYLSPTYKGPHFGLGSYPSRFTYKTVCANNNGVHKEWPDTHNYGLNYSTNSPKTPVSKVGDKTIRGIFDDQTFPTYIEYLINKCPHCKIEVIGHASPQGRAACNQQLADARADNVLNKIKKEWCPAIGWSVEKCNDRVKKLPSYQIKASESQCNPKTGSATDTYACKYDRRVKIHFEYMPEEALKEIAPPEDCIVTTQQMVTSQVKEKFYNETLFFDKLAKTDRFIFDKFREKIKYFHPAFHSTTPEGLNSRLTFLHQCTRQGPTLEQQGASNLAFGRAPICILRVGDFFYTKIAIDSLSIDYEPLVWDLNPEGIGVQPMIANVSLSFKFIGAESLLGPINKLQNALSFNYYANAGVYEGRADYVSEKEQPETKDIGPDGKEVILKSIKSSTGLFFNNGRYTINPEVTTFTEELSKKNSCDTDQTKENDKTNSGVANSAASTASTATTVADINKNTTLNTTLNGQTVGCAISTVKQFNGTFSVEFNVEGGYSKDYQAIVRIYDKNKKPREVSSVPIKKGQAKTTSSNVIGLMEPEFIFDTSGIDYDYQVEFDIVGLKKLFSKITLKQNKCT